VGVRRCFAYFELLGSGGKALAANDFFKDPSLCCGKAESCGKVLDLTAEIGRRIDNKDCRSGLVEVKNTDRLANSKRDHMGDERRAISATRQLYGAADAVFGMSGPGRRAYERMQAGCGA